MTIKRRLFDVYLTAADLTVQIFGASPEALKDKNIRLDLTRFLKGKSCEAKFHIVKKDDKLLGEIFLFSIPQSYIRRLIGHDISIIEDSFIVKCSNGKLRIKPFLITRNKVHRSVRAELRKQAKEEVELFCAGKSREDIFNAVLNSTIQKTMSKKLKKVYPLGICELRTVEVLKK